MAREFRSAASANSPLGVRRWLWPGVSLLLVLLAFILRLYRLDAQSIWWDEGHSIEMASAPIVQIPTLPGMDVHPPAYFEGLHLWMALVGDSQFSLRYFSLIFSLLTVALLIRFGRTLGGRQAGLWAGLLTAVSPFYVAYAQEVRMYAMVTFFAAASVYCLWQLLAQRNPPHHLRGRVYLAGYILATAAGLYTHYFFLFLIFFENLVWLWRTLTLKPIRWKARLGLWFGSQLVILLLFVPQLRLATQQITTYANPNLKPPTLPEFLNRTWQAYTLGLTIDPAAARLYLGVLALLLVGGLLVYGRDRRFVFLSGWLIVPLGLYFVILQSRPSFEPRYMMLVTPSILLLFALILTSGRLIAFFGLGAVAIFAVGLHSYFTDPAFFKDDAEAVTRWLAAETTVDDVVLVDVPHPFHYYARDIPAPTHYLFVDVHTAADTLNREALGRKRFYWVTWWGSDTDPRGVIPYLLQKQAGSGQGEQQFRGYRAVWYNLSDQPFSLPADLPPTDINFDHVLKLDGLAYSQEIASGEAAWVTLELAQLAEMNLNYKLSLRLRSPEGKVLAQSDKFILNDRHFQTAAWPLDDPALNRGINVLTLPLTDPAYRGPLTLEAVVYNADTLAAIAVYGAPTTNDDLVSAQIGQIEVR